MVHVWIFAVSDVIITMYDEMLPTKSAGSFWINRLLEGNDYYDED